MRISLNELRAGDTVVVSGDIEGEVVFVSASSSYAPDFPMVEWPSEKYNGVMIRQITGALIFHPTDLFDEGKLYIERLETGDKT
jgi:hypothetical protein